LPDGGWDWCGRGVSHIDFDEKEDLPLIQGAFLGHGRHGPVHSTKIRDGQLVAWKRKFCNSNVNSKKEREEINILQKLQHPHIIDLVGTYTKGPYLGLLLHPVAVTDLWTFLEDLNLFQHVLPEHSDIYDKARLRFDRLELNSNNRVESGRNFLRRRLGCLVQAVCYLHRNKIRHKDLKVSKSKGTNNTIVESNSWFLDICCSSCNVLERYLRHILNGRRSRVQVP
jgi:serine/threonine protein kinase